jgi:NAD(P)H-nitrite reductase large subunit
MLLNPAVSTQVTTTVLDDGRELESALVVVGVGARPNTQLLQGQVDVEDQKPGGIPVRCCRVQHPEQPV